MLTLGNKIGFAKIVVFKMRLTYEKWLNFMNHWFIESDRTFQNMSIWDRKNLQHVGLKIGIG